MVVGSPFGVFGIRKAVEWRKPAELRGSESGENRRRGLGSVALESNAMACGEWLGFAWLSSVLRSFSHAMDADVGSLFRSPGMPRVLSVALPPAAACTRL
ncbi:LexA repressor [Striga asiatica]|uniref:LexA repressor n=1 Tax=Striga asiatica TaxID=4170 RepID=A0A5A7RHD5_STRAF|nr:LexA repressor [Striga asiatica]